MKSIARRWTILLGSGLALAVLAGLGVATAQAAPLLRVDIGRAGQAVEPGYTGFSTLGGPNDASQFVPQVFAGGIWDLEFVSQGTTTRNYGEIPTTPSGDLLEDSLLVNSSSGYFDLILDDLAPGDYTLTTYHHSFDIGGARAESFGGLEGDTLTSLGLLTSTTGTDISNPTTLAVQFTTTALVDGYVLRFEPDNAGPSFHFDFSGFDLDGPAVIPEPSTALLLGAGLATMAARRRRSSRA